MNPLSSLGVPSITGGAAAPSRADAKTGDLFLQMNSPFSVAGQNGKASSEGGATGFNQDILLWAIIVGGIVLILK